MRRRVYGRPATDRASCPSTRAGVGRLAARDCKPPLRNSEGGTPKVCGMKPPASAISPRSRDDAVARIRSLAMVTAVVCLVGTGGFGALAALNYSGTISSDDSTTNTTNATVDQSTTQDDSTTDDSSSSSSSALQGAPPAVSSTRQS